MSLFNNLSSDNLEKQGDSLGGFSLFESGLYDGTVKLAYADKYDSGAMFVALTLELGGKEYRETITITNKKGENFYLKDGKKMPLPGFTQINDLVLLITGIQITRFTWDHQMTATSLPGGLLYLALPISAALSLLGLALGGWRK